MTAPTPRERVLRALDALLPYLHGFVNQAFDASAYRGKRVDADIGPLAHAMRKEWHGVFANRLDKPVLNYVHELLDIRNRLAHSEAFDEDEARRARDTIRLVAKAIGAPLSEYDRSASHGVEAATVGSAAIVAPAADGVVEETVVASATRVVPTGRRIFQRDVMRAVWARCAPDEERTIREYAAAERRGEAPRKNNASGHTPEQYARALLADGQKKGWLRTSNLQHENRTRDA
jgi:hypothetical protein